METRNIETTPGMVFDVSIAGREDGPLVLMLHGFGVSRFFWNAQVEAVAEAGFFAVAPNQRGYAAEARPDPRRRLGAWGRMTQDDSPPPPEPDPGPPDPPPAPEPTDFGSPFPKPNFDDIEANLPGGVDLEL